MNKAKVKSTSNKKITQITLPDERFYEKGGKYYPAVNYILQAYPKNIGFYKWLASKGWDEAERIKEEAGDRGSKVHNAIYDLLKGKPVKYTDKYWNENTKDFEMLTDREWECLIAFQNFWEDKKPQLIASEIVCYSEKYFYAGTIDFIGIVDGKVMLIDWKTGSKIYPSQLLQVAAYWQAENEKGKFKPAETAVLRLGTKHTRGYEPLKKSGKGKRGNLMNLKENKEAFSVFLAVKKTWGFEHPKAKPDIKEIPEVIKLKIVKLRKKHGITTKRGTKRNR